MNYIRLDEIENSKKQTPLLCWSCRHFSYLTVLEIDRTHSEGTFIFVSIHGEGVITLLKSTCKGWAKMEVDMYRPFPELIRKQLGEIKNEVVST